MTQEIKEHFRTIRIWRLPRHHHNSVLHRAPVSNTHLPFISQWGSWREWLSWPPWRCNLCFLPFCWLSKWQTGLWYGNYGRQRLPCGWLCAL